MLQIIFFFVNDYRLIDALQIVNLLLQCDISEMTAVTLLQCYQEKHSKLYCQILIRRPVTVTTQIAVSLLTRTKFIYNLWYYLLIFFGSTEKCANGTRMLK